MGLMLKQLEINKSYWLISDPYNDIPFIEPRRAKFLKYDHVEADNRYWKDFGSYQYTMIFEDDIRIPMYDSGLKSGHKITKGYYVAETSGQLMMIMKRIAYPTHFDIREKEGFDYVWFRKTLKRLEEENPELLI